MVGDFKGKLAYASPEQFGLYGGKVDARSDIYSFGLVLAEAASGAPIPMGQTFYEAVEMRKAAPRIPPNVPSSLQALIEPLIRSDPNARPQSAQELVSLAGRDATAPKLRELKADTDTNGGTDQPAPTHWLIPLLYSATAVGFGIGLGFMIWLYRAAGIAPVPLPKVPISAPATGVVPVPTGVPAPAK